MSKNTILIVDDEPGFIRILQIVFQRAGYQTRSAPDGIAALQSVERQAPDLIVLDDNMPNLSGADVCRQLKADPTTRHIPIMMYSAGVRVHDAAFLAHIGADAALKKPTMPDEILNTVQSLLSARAASV